jgi:hypothetical protein
LRRSQETGSWRRRVPAAALMPIAALAVHQLRFMLAFGPSRSSSELAGTGHSYLSSVTPWVVLVLALGFGLFLGRLARAWRSGEAAGPARRNTVRVWFAATAALVLIYAGQEFLEGLFATGHHAGLAGIFGDGGLWALPAAAAVGGTLALLVCGGRVVVALAARRGRKRVIAAAEAPAPLRGPRPVLLVAASPLAACAPERAPPFAR